MSKCPKCNTVVNQVQLAEVNIYAGINSWRGVSYSCPVCFSVLSVAIDPVALKTDTVTDVSAELRKLQAELADIRHQIARMAQQLRHP